MRVAREHSGLWVPVDWRDPTPLPVHPQTGQRAIGFLKNGTPIYPIQGMGNNYFFTPIGPFHTAVGAAFGTFTTIQDVSPATGIPIIAPGQLGIGTKVHFVASGEFSTTATPTLQLGFYYGTTAVVPALSGAITTGTATAWPWIIEYWGTVVGVGTVGSIVGEGTLRLGTSLTAFAESAIPITAAARTVAIDTTVSKLVGVAAAYSASSASNTVKTNDLRVIVLN